jgi:hypothetical protein
MNILIGVLSLLLGLGVITGIGKLVDSFFPEFRVKFNQHPAIDSRWKYYFYKIKESIGMWFPFLFLFYSCHVTALLLEIEFPETSSSVFWIFLFGLIGGVTIIIIVWIIIQYLGDLSYEHGLKGIIDKSSGKQNKFFRFYMGILGWLFFSLFLIPFSYNQFDYDENIYNYLLPLSYYGLISMVVLLLGLVGLEIRVESNIKERTTGVKDNEDNSRHKY